MNEEKLPFSQWNPLIAEDFVKRWEGLRLKAYRCPGGVLTVGYGHTKGVKPGQTITRQEAEKLIRDDLIEHAEGLAPYVTCKLTEGQYGNLVKDEHGKQMYEILPGLMNRREDEVRLM